MWNILKIIRFYIKKNFNWSKKIIKMDSSENQVEKSSATPTHAINLNAGNANDKCNVS